ncbi:MAG: Lar family restriction alleviation protein [Candidatus Baldrarchaeia archaeon]
MTANPCPFCKCETLEIRQGWCTYYVHCPHCGTDGPEDTNKVRAIREWNKGNTVKREVQNES